MSCSVVSVTFARFAVSTALSVALLFALSADGWIIMSAARLLCSRAPKRARLDFSSAVDTGNLLLVSLARGGGGG